MPLSDVHGQQAAISLLQRFLEGEHLPHALLFVGPEGVGKHLTAKALAQVLLCEKRKGGGAAVAPSLFGDPAPAAKGPADACGRCPACQRVMAGTHPDLHEVGGSGARGLIQVDTVRELLRSLQLHAVEGGAKVAILDPADQMNREAANTLLKTLEEPPAGTTLILIAAERSLLLPTIVSRCQVVRFGLLDRLHLQKYFEETRDELGLPGDPRIVQTIVALAGGSIGRAVALAGGEIEKRRGELKSLLQRLDGADPDVILQWASEIADLSKEDSEGFKGALDGLTLFFRDVAARIAGKEPGDLLSQDLLPEVERWAGQLSLTGAVGRVEALVEIRRALDLNAHKEMAAYALGSRIALPSGR